jgi:hypothetical protein
MTLIEAPNVSEAWLALAQSALAQPGAELSPAVVCIRPIGSDDEDPNVRVRVDEALEARGFSSVRTVANTIFPASMWRLAAGDRARLYARYRALLPRIRAAEPQLNRHGLYFERLVEWGDGPHGGNQLEFIINQHRRGRRRTAYQASIFDPARDHSSAPRQGFPCLQHVSFLPAAKGLSMNAFFATQRIFDKAYGNYLGLARLGRFMAQGLDSELLRLTCYVGVAKLGVSKGDEWLDVALGDSR